MGTVIGLAEFIEKVGKTIKNKDKVEALKMNDSIQLRIIMQGIYDHSVQWDLPEGTPPYTPSKLVDQENVLIRDIEKLRYFVKGFRDDIPLKKKEMMFIELLERVAPKDAEMLIQLKDKKPFKGILPPVIKEAFPDMIIEKKVDVEVQV